MKNEKDKIELYANTDFYNHTSEKPHLLFIHGFTGSSKDWDNVVPAIDSTFSKISIDLIGHGKSPDPRDSSFYSSGSISEQINDTLIRLGADKVIIIGYSMGGRAALNFTFVYPRKVEGLFLESTSAGIESDEERIERIENDKKIVDNILKEGLERFVDYWMNIPIFSSQKKLDDERLERIKSEKLDNSAVGLANSLLGFGTGEMPSYWNRLQELNIPVQLISGELDKKYIELNKRMNELIYKSYHTIVQDAGHNIHLEKPSEFIILVNSFLRTNFY